MQHGKLRRRSQVAQTSKLLLFNSMGQTLIIAKPEGRPVLEDSQLLLKLSVTSFEAVINCPAKV